MLEVRRSRINSSCGPACVYCICTCVSSLSQTRHCSGSLSKTFQQTCQDLFFSLPAFILQPGQEKTICTGVRLPRPVLLTNCDIFNPMLKPHLGQWFLWILTKHIVNMSWGSRSHTCLRWAKLADMMCDPGLAIKATELRSSSIGLYT